MCAGQTEVHFIGDLERPEGYFARVDSGKYPCAEFMSLLICMEREPPETRRIFDEEEERQYK